MIEILVVMGIIALIGGFALFVSMDTYRGATFRADRGELIAILERARSEAVNNVCIGSSCRDAMAHGVSIQPDTYVLFQGESYATRDSAVDSIFTANPATTRTGPTEVVFLPLSGGTTEAGDIVQSGQGHISTTTITEEGRIYWTN